MNVLAEEFNQSHPGQVDFLAVPTNNFNLQEPGSNSEILLANEHVRPGGGFKPLYKMAEKNSANGAQADPLFKFLKENCQGPQQVIGDPGSFYFTPVAQDDITWNFEKFLMDQNGVPYKRYSPDDEPLVELRNDMIYLLENPPAKKDAPAPPKPEPLVHEDPKPAEPKPETEPAVHPKPVPVEPIHTKENSVKSHVKATKKQRKMVKLPVRRRKPNQVHLGALLGKIDN